MHTDLQALIDYHQSLNWIEKSIFPTSLAHCFLSNTSLHAILTIAHQVRPYRALFGGLNQFLSSQLAIQWRFLREQNLLNHPKEQEDFEKLVSYPDKNIVTSILALCLNAGLMTSKNLSTLSTLIFFETPATYNPFVFDFNNDLLDLKKTMPIGSKTKQKNSLCTALYLLQSKNFLTSTDAQHWFDFISQGHPEEIARCIIWLRQSKLLNSENEKLLLGVDLSTALSSTINILYRSRLLSVHQQTNFETLALKKELQEKITNYYLAQRYNGNIFGNTLTLSLFEILEQKPDHLLETEDDLIALIDKQLLTSTNYDTVVQQSNYGNLESGLKLLARTNILNTDAQHRERYLKFLCQSTSKEEAADLLVSLHSKKILGNSLEKEILHAVTYCAIPKKLIYFLSILEVNGLLSGQAANLALENYQSLLQISNEYLSYLKSRGLTHSELLTLIKISSNDSLEPSSNISLLENYIEKIRLSHRGLTILTRVPTKLTDTALNPNDNSESINNLRKLYQGKLNQLGLSKIFQEIKYWLDFNLTPDENDPNDQAASKLFLSFIKNKTNFYTGALHVSTGQILAYCWLAASDKALVKGSVYHTRLSVIEAFIDVNTDSCINKEPCSSLISCKINQLLQSLVLMHPAVESKVYLSLSTASLKLQRMMINEANIFLMQVLSNPQDNEYHALVACKKENISDYLWSKIKEKVSASILLEFEPLFRKNNFEEFLESSRDIDLSAIFDKIPRQSSSRNRLLFSPRRHQIEENSSLSTTIKKAWS